MRNICLTLEYLGTNYCGFQKQKNGLSIQEVLEDVISQSIGESITVYPSGRTDAGVHALGQVVNFFTNCKIQSEKFSTILNLKLPEDIRVIDSKEVDLNFHSRKSAVSKTYIYKIYTGNILSVFDAKRYLSCKYKLDFDLMNEGAKLIEGTHDFSSFVASNSTAKTTTRTIYKACFTKENDYITFEINGNGFLYNMVRIIVGTLLDLGRGKISLKHLSHLLKGGNNRTQAGKTVKPDGLYLKEVYYD